MKEGDSPSRRETCLLLKQYHFTLWLRFSFFFILLVCWSAPWCLLMVIESKVFFFNLRVTWRLSQIIGKKERKNDTCQASHWTQLKISTLSPINSFFLQFLPNFKLGNVRVTLTNRHCLFLVFCYQCLVIISTNIGDTIVELRLSQLTVLPSVRIYHHHCSSIDFPWNWFPVSVWPELDLSLVMHHRYIYAVWEKSICHCFVDVSVSEPWERRTPLLWSFTTIRPCSLPL